MNYFIIFSIALLVVSLSFYKYIAVEALRHALLRRNVPLERRADMNMFLSQCDLEDL